MTVSQDFSDRRSSGREPEMSNFAQTCNRLSQYLKDKGKLRDRGLEIAGKLDAKVSTTTRNLYPIMEKSGEISERYEVMDLFPQHAGGDCPSKTELGAMDKANSSGSETVQIEPPNAAEMTIFYGGKVLVFDNFPPDKLGELMLLASSGPGADLPNPRTNPTQEQLQPQPPPIGSAMPIARRGSLHRFLDKRKDRVAARAPYQVHGDPSTSAPKHEEQIDLNQ